MQQAAGLFFYWICMNDLVALTSFEKRTQQLVEPLLTNQGYELVRLRLLGSKIKSLQIMAERLDGAMTVGDCAKLSHSLSALLEVEDSVASEYSLEISSPGIDRPLTRIQHFERWIGFEATVELSEMLDGRKRFKGIIVRVVGSSIYLKTEMIEIKIDFRHIVKARLILTDALLEHTSKASMMEEQRRQINEFN